MDVVDEAMSVIRARANLEGGVYDEMATSWRIAGIWEREGPEAALAYARTAPFQKKKRTIRIGYATTIEILCSV